MPPSFSLARAVLANDGPQVMRLGLMSLGKWASRRGTRRDEVATGKFGWPQATLSGSRTFPNRYLLNWPNGNVATVKGV